MNIKNGIAYSGSQEECGTLEEKIHVSKVKGMKYIQVRTKDIENMLLTGEKIDQNTLTSLEELVNSYDGEISVHLPTPKWDGINLLNKKTKEVEDLVKGILVPLGMKKYTIHPYFNREVWETLTPQEKKRVLLSMGDYFSSLVVAGASIAIENIPVRNIKEIEALPDSPKKEKLKKNISYGMTIPEIDRILTITRTMVGMKSNNSQLANERVGITYDTGHSLVGINDRNAARTEVEKWIQYFKRDIMIYHITPSIGKDSKGNDYVNEEASREIIDCVFRLTQKYDIDALALIEAHASIDAMSHLYDMACQQRDLLGDEGNPQARTKER